MDYTHHLTDDDWDRIEKRAWSLSPFDEGDTVTVEPTEHDINYAGKELEGQPLVIDSVAMQNELHYARPRHLESKDWMDDPEERLVEVDGLVEEMEVHGGHPHVDYSQVYLGTVRHTFENTERHHAMSITSLIAWEEFRAEYPEHPIVLDAELEAHGEERAYLIERDESCAICGCELLRVERSQKRGLGTFGTESCAACGNVVSRVRP